MTDWVKFHLEICKGAKKGIPRAERFVYMELAREARANAGYIVLPVDMSDIDAVCEVLGGDREEVLAALRRFTKGPQPSLVFEGPKHRRILRVINWANWNSLPEPSGASTPRSQKSRATRGLAKPRNHVDEPPPVKLRKHSNQGTLPEVPGVSSHTDAPETLKQRTGKDSSIPPRPVELRHDSGIVRNGGATPVASPGNGSQSRSRVEERRGRERADPDPEDVVYLLPPNRSTETPPHPEHGPLVGGLEVDLVVQIYDHYLVGWKSRNHQGGGKGGRPPGLTPFRRQLITARLAEGLTAEELMLACDGIWRSEWHVERGYTMVEHVMRSREHVDRFVAVPNSSRVQSSDGYTEEDAKEAQSRFLAEAEEKIAAAAAAGYKDPLA